MKIQDIHDYRDIIELPYVKSQKHIPMKQTDRSAQFAPFAALTGHKEAVHETGRRVDAKRELDEHKMQYINEQLQKIQAIIKQRPEINVTHFVIDEKKEGGVYLTTRGSLRRIDELQRLLIFVDKTTIYIDDVFDIEIGDTNKLQ